MEGQEECGCVLLSQTCSDLTSAFLSLASLAIVICGGILCKLTVDDDDDDDDEIWIA